MRQKPRLSLSQFQLAVRLAKDHRHVRLRTNKVGEVTLTRWPCTWDYDLPPKREWLERFIIQEPHERPVHPAMASPA